jgi:hypothetical protein
MLSGIRVPSRIHVSMNTRIRAWVMASAAAIIITAGGYSVLEEVPAGVEGPTPVAAGQPSSIAPDADGLQDSTGVQDAGESFNASGAGDSAATDSENQRVPSVTLSAAGGVGTSGGPVPHADAGAAVDPFGAPMTSGNGAGPTIPATMGNSPGSGTGSVGGAGTAVSGGIPDLAADGVLRPEGETAPATTATSLSLQRVRPRSGRSSANTVVLRATLVTAKGAKPVVGTVAVWTRTSSGKPWVVVEGSARTTSSTGKVQITLTQKARKAQYRLAFAEAAPYRASTSRPIAVTLK